MIDSFIISLIDLMVAIKSFLNVLIVSMFWMQLFEIILEDKVVLESPLEGFAVQVEKILSFGRLCDLFLYLLYFLVVLY